MHRMYRKSSNPWQGPTALFSEMMWYRLSCTVPTPVAAAIVVGPRRELQQKLKQVWDISSDLELEYGIIISPVVIPYDEYMKYKDDVPYYRNISREGVNIVA